MRRCLPVPGVSRELSQWAVRRIRFCMSTLLDSVGRAPGGLVHLAGVFISKLYLAISLCIQVQRDPPERGGCCISTLDV
jgi:hypothetical protein